MLQKKAGVLNCWEDLSWQQKGSYSLVLVQLAVRDRKCYVTEIHHTYTC